MNPDEERAVMRYQITELQNNVKSLGALPTDVVLLVKAVESLESRFRNLQRGFYFFGACVVTASIGFGITALRVFGAPPVAEALRILGVL